MAEIYVAGSSNIQDVIDQLEQLNTQFMEKANAIDAEHKSLVSKWEGDASTAFEEHYQNERQNFDVFYNTIHDYINALRIILANYEDAERRNTGIASE